MRMIGQWASREALGRAEAVHISLMILVAAVLRFPGLGELSFYGDEEYTALAVRGILEGGKPEMPSGLMYWRGVIYSYAAAVSAYTFGLNEFSVRLPSAVFGVLAVPVFYVLARCYLSTVPASLACWLLVLSAWHIDLSREGRMYATFLTWFLLALVLYHRGFIEGKQRFQWAAVGAGIVTTTLHEVGVVLLLLWALPLLVSDRSDGHVYRASGAVATVSLGLVWVLYQRFESFVVPGVHRPHMDSVTGSGLLKYLHIQFKPKLWMLSHLLEQHGLLFLGLALISLGTWFAIWRYYRYQEELTLAESAGGGLVIILAVTNLFGVALSLVILYFLVRPSVAAKWVGHRYGRATIALFGCVFLFWMAYGMYGWKGEGVSLGFEGGVLKKILKDSLYYPATHILVYLEAFPIMTLFVMCGTVMWASLWARKSIELQPDVLFRGFWIPLIALGLTREWIALRYTLPVYPFYLMIFGWTISTWIESGHTYFTRRWPRMSLSPLGSPVAGTALVVIFLLFVPFANEEHNWGDARRMGSLSYQEAVNPVLHGFPLHPDHKGAGEFVRAHMEIHDVIIAEDVFQQHYYVGHVDYWLTSQENLQAYGYQQGSQWYDIYTGTPIITASAQLADILHCEPQRRTWFITSSELPGGMPASVPHSCDGQERFVGRDGSTRVFLFTASL